jgi:hypothetical protein
MGDTVLEITLHEVTCSYQKQLISGVGSSIYVESQ